LLFPLRVGASAVLLSESSPAHVLQTISDFRATICFTAPTGYRSMLAKIRQADVSSLKKCVSAGEGLSLATFDAWRKATGLRIIDGIGSTEMLHIFISAAENEVCPGATGKVVPGFQARLVDDLGNDVPVGQVGRLAVRGPTGCRYLDSPEQQMAYVQNGWNVTGDAFRKDERDYFWFQARTDDLIVSAGYKIAAPEIENVLMENDKVAECAVIGALDPHRGTIVKAFIVLKAGVAASEVVTKELQEFTKAQVAPYKYPRAIKFVDRLPKTATGKLQRQLLKEEQE